MILVMFLMKGMVNVWISTSVVQSTLVLITRLVITQTAAMCAVTKLLRNLIAVTGLVENEA